MKYYTFYGDSKYFYCYSEDGKIYRGENSKFTPGIKYFVILMLANGIIKYLNDSFQDSIDNKLSIAVIFIGIIISILLSVLTYKKVKKVEATLLKETFLTKEQFETYVFERKKTFNKQWLIVYFCLLFTCFFFALFYIFHSFLFYFLSTGCSYITTFLILSIDPIKAYRFFKHFSKDNR